MCGIAGFMRRDGQVSDPALPAGPDGLTLVANG